MAELSPGKLRGLSTTSTPDGMFTILAVDHRDAMRAILNPGDPSIVTPDALTNIKLRLIEELGAMASGVLLDPEYSAAQALVRRALPGSVGFLAALEAQGYLGEPEARRTALLDGWSVEKAKRLGAAGIKLLVLYRPDGAAALGQERMISAVVAECARYDIALFLEPIAYAFEGEGSTSSPVFAAKRRSIVIETVRRLTAIGPEVLKVQFPLDTRHNTDRAEWADACRELTETATVPWALLSGGDPFELFRDQVATACEAGASGFMVGRALWGDLVVADLADREAILEGTVRPRFAELIALCGDTGTDWATRHHAQPVDSEWFHTY